jgi:hypothetical protein
MASRDIFAHGHSALNPFVYADIGIRDGVGGQTIASLFGRGGYDPWEEAARLARLPAGMAVTSLAAMIANAPASACSLPEATAIAERLVALLPGPVTAVRLVAARHTPRLPRFNWLATVAFALGVVVVLAFAWLFVADAFWPGDHARLVDPLAREAPR